MAENIINIGGRLHDTSSNHTVTGANEVLDDDLQKKQSVINDEQLEHNQESDNRVEVLENTTVRFTPQSLTEGKQEQARQNISTYSKDQVNNIVSRTPETDVIVVNVPSDEDIATYLSANIPLADRPNNLFRVPGPTNTSFSEWAWDGTNWVMLDEKDYGIDSAPAYLSDNIVNSKGIIEAFSTLGTTGNLTFQNYIRNVFVIPTTSAKFAWIKSLAEKALKITYIGINSNTFATNSKFGIQLSVPGVSTINALTYNVPDFSKGYIVEMDRIGNFGGELGEGFRVFVEFNQNIDFSMEATLVYTEGTVFVQPINRTALSIFCNLFNLAGDINDIKDDVEEIQDNYVEKLERTVVGDVIKNLKDARIDYRALSDIVTFKGNLFDKDHVINGYYAINGGYSVAASYSAAINPVPVEAGATYTATHGDTIHIDVISSEDFSFIKHISIDTAGDADWNVVYNSTDNTLSFTVPVNTKGCVLISCATWVIEEGDIAVNKGSAISSYNFVASFENAYVEKVNRKVIGTVYEYLKDVKTDYRSLSDIITFKGNLVDKDRVINGYYVNNGGYIAVSNYSATVIPIPLEAGQTYIATYGNTIHIDILSADNLKFIKHISIDGAGDETWNITYNSESNTLSFTVPNDVDCCMLASGATWVIESNGLVINKGTVIRNNKFIVSFGEDESNANSRNYIVVDKNGNGDYQTLTAATNEALDGSIILVMPGVYDNEVVTAGKTKTLFIIGVDRDKCVIKNNNGDYNYCPICIASGLLRNLTVIEEATTTPNNGSYAVHVDFTTMHNSTLRIENCTLRSNVPTTGAIGAGLIGGGKLIIKGCHLISGTSGRALYCHDNWREGYDGEQWLIVEDCIIESPSFSQEAIRIQGQGITNVRTFNESQYYIEFVRNRVKGTAGFTNWNQDVTITDDDFQGVMNLRLSDLSWGNSLPVFNNAQ